MHPARAAQEKVEGTSDFCRRLCRRLCNRRRDSQAEPTPQEESATLLEPAPRGEQVSQRGSALQANGIKTHECYARPDHPWPRPMRNDEQSEVPPAWRRPLHNIHTYPARRRSMKEQREREPELRKIYERTRRRELEARPPSYEEAATAGRGVKGAEHTQVDTIPNIGVA